MYKSWIALTFLEKCETAFFILVECIYYLSYYVYIDSMYDSIDVKFVLILIEKTKKSVVTKEKWLP